MDDQPSASFFLSPPPVSLSFFACELLMQEERGSRGGGADSDLRADWLSKRLAAACSGRQPAKKRFLCTFTTVNGKFNQSYIEMVISCTCTCTGSDQAHVCAGVI